MLKLHSLSGGVLAALTAAFLFGASTPFAKQLTGVVSPLLLAGLLYLGSGIGLGAIKLARDKNFSSGLSKYEWGWLFLAIISGGVIAPVLLMTGLAQTSAATASLLLNLESVMTALLAWIFFKEHTDRRIVLGMFLITVGSMLLSWPKQAGLNNWAGFLSIAAACLCWAIDNNLTRKISSTDSVFIAGSKGLMSGIVNVSLAFAAGLTFPAWSKINSALLIGFFGYGVSLVLFVLALRGLGTARASAYFSTAPFIGAAIAIIFFHEPASITFWTAAILMGMGVGIHLAEYHDHVHTHELMSHDHYHFHNEHHQHSHDYSWDNAKPHSHPHQHDPITHSHHHYPDFHHRHKHK